MKKKLTICISAVLLIAITIGVIIGVNTYRRNKLIAEQQEQARIRKEQIEILKNRFEQAVGAYDESQVLEILLKADADYSEVYNYFIERIVNLINGFSEDWNKEKKDFLFGMYNQVSDSKNNRIKGLLENLNKAIEEYKSGYKKEYASVLKNAVNSGRKLYFELIYLDEDDIPELVYNSGESHSAGACVYTYYNGTVTELIAYDSNNSQSYKFLGSWGSIKYKPYSGYVASVYSGQGHVIATIYRLENGQLIEDCIFNDSTRAPFSMSPAYMVNGESVSQSEYQNKVYSYGFGDLYFEQGYSQTPVSVVSYIPNSNAYLLSHDNIQRVFGY